eukprot:1423214-Prymnesium_polylepis.1
MGDARSKADRGAIPVRVDTPRESALTRGGPHPATPGGEDAASPGHAGELVARLCVLYTL